MSRAITLAEARQKYIHRFTMEHIPTWAMKQREDGSYYAPQYASDQEWYENCVFPGEGGKVSEGGVHRNSKHCYSSGQTWPLGQSLSSPFQIEGAKS